MAGLIRYKKHWKAYYNNPYEIEAYQVEDSDLTNEERDILDESK